MPITIENTQINEFFTMLQKQYSLTPEKRFSITFDMRIIDPEPKKPHYDIPKMYPDRVKNILLKAKDDLKKLKMEGYTREDAIKGFFEIQDEISQHIKNRQ